MWLKVNILPSGKYLGIRVRCQLIYAIVAHLLGSLNIHQTENLTPGKMSAMVSSDVKHVSVMMDSVRGAQESEVSPLSLYYRLHIITDRL